VGQIAFESLEDDEKERWQNLASEWYVEQSDATTHSAAGWLLRKWEISEPKLSGVEKAVSKRDWFVNSIGATMIKLRPGSTAAVSQLDPLEPYRRQLSELSKLNPSEFTKPNIRIRRAVARYKIGEIQKSLEDLDWLANHDESKTRREILATDENVEYLRELYTYRSLATSRLGKSDESVKSITTLNMLNSRDAEMCGGLVEIQVPAWLGDYSESKKRLDQVLKTLQELPNNEALFHTARAASQCAKAALGSKRDEASQFSDIAFEILTELFQCGYLNQEQVQKEPDFANLRSEHRFAELIQKKGGISEFWVADREISRGQFELFIGDANFHRDLKTMSGRITNTPSSLNLNHPADNVSWGDAVLFCNWLSLREGRTPSYVRKGTAFFGNVLDGKEYDSWESVKGANGYKLLNTNQWEFACRAGTETRFSSGDDESLLIGYCQMFPVDQVSECGVKFPNPLGVFDLHGNVWEWCEDRMGRSLYRIRRGGSWKTRAADCQSSHFTSATPLLRSADLGLRISLPSFSIPVE
jgi:formylglycine-generating enzyme